MRTTTDIGISSPGRRGPLGRRAAALSIALVLGLTAAACGSNDGGTVDADRPERDRTTTTQAERAPGTSLVAHVKGDAITPLDAPETGAPIETLSNPRFINDDPNAPVPTVFLVNEAAPETDGWLQVYLPMRPNGSLGWIPESEVEVRTVSHRLEISLSGFHLALYENDEMVLETDVGLGRAEAPTPPGTYFITELLQPPDENGAYGPYAYGLSGFSDVIFDFGGGPGQLGVHGTNDPSSIGGNASSGCIRLPNDVITELAGILPLGTPVIITA